MMATTAVTAQLLLITHGLSHAHHIPVKAEAPPAKAVIFAER